MCGYPTHSNMESSNSVATADHENNLQLSEQVFANHHHTQSRVCASWSTILNPCVSVASRNLESERRTLHWARACARLRIQILTGNNSQSESQFWCKLQQSGTAGFWMSCVAAVAPAVGCVKRPGSGRKGQKGEGGPNFKTNFPLFCQALGAPHLFPSRCLVRNLLHFTLCLPLWVPPPIPCSAPPPPLCQILWGKSSRRYWKCAPLNMQNTQNQLNLSFLKSTQAGARTHTHQPSTFYWQESNYLTHIRVQVQPPFRRTSNLTSLR